ncbi:hypothetical protein [Streptomyces sp. NPDC091212]|uniref:hypothetical protein n=1 Tax=Streptomyces sp. NPDC091212 TaxID=3155191 RepID=UPI0034353BDD
MDIYGAAAAIMTLVSVITWILVAALRKVPAVCEEAEKAVHAIRSLRKVIRGQERTAVTDSQPTRE